MPALLKCSKERSFTLIKIAFSFTVKLTVMKCVFLFCSFACLFICLFVCAFGCLSVCLLPVIKSVNKRLSLSCFDQRCACACRPMCILFIFLYFLFFFRTKVYHTGNFLFWQSTTYYQCYRSCRALDHCTINCHRFSCPNEVRSFVSAIESSRSRTFVAKVITQSTIATEEIVS